MSLQKYIDNRNNNVKVGIRSIIYWVGSFNVKQGESIQRYQLTRGVPLPKIQKEAVISIDPGLYNVDELSIILTKAGMIIKVNKTNGMVTLIIPPSLIIELSDGIKTILGFSGGGSLKPGIHIGDKPINLAPTKTLYINLDQINTSENFLDGSPSTLIGVAAIPDKAFGEVVTIHYERPEFRNLMAGTISELKLQVKDQNNDIIDNNNMPISMMLQII